MRFWFEVVNCQGRTPDNIYLFFWEKNKVSASLFGVQCQLSGMMCGMLKILREVKNTLTKIGISYKLKCGEVFKSLLGRATNKSKSCDSALSYEEARKSNEDFDYMAGNSNEEA